MDLVFTPDFTERLRRKYSHLPEYDQPILCYVALDPEAEETRKRIETWLADIPPTPRLPLLVKRLQSPTKLQEAYHELVVFHLFRSLGHRIQYEMSLSDGVNAVTPDWCILKADGTPWFAVEVFTANPSDEERSNIERRRRFLDRLRAIQGNVVLGIDELPGYQPPEKLKSDKIASDLEVWLASTPHFCGLETVLGDMRFKVEAVCPHAKTLQYIGPTRMLTVNVRGLKRKICDKIRSYRTILTSIQVPLVVAVVPGDFILDKSDIQTALIGQEVVSPVQFGPEGATTYAVATANNGLLTGEQSVDSIVSVVAWVDRVKGEWSLELFHHPAARYPLTLKTA